MNPRTGRPLSDNKKEITVRARMTDEDVKMLDYCCEVLNESRSEVIRKGIKICYDKAKEQK